MPEVAKYNIGIIGGGHLGISLAKALLRNKIALATLKISFSGSPATRLQLRHAGLEENISSNALIAAGCDVVFIAVRPAQVSSLKGIKFKESALVVSCIAGCEIATLEEIINHGVTRAMPSSPITIDDGRAVCALFPYNVIVAGLLAETGFTLYPVGNENLFNIFTACVCLPAAFLQMQVDNIAFSATEVTAHFSDRFAGFDKMFHWAYALTPFNLSVQDKLQYINRMATKGGITEAMIGCIKQGLGLINAIQKGIDRGSELSLAASTGAANL